MLANGFPDVKCEASRLTEDMSKDLPEGHAFKEEQNLFRYCNGNLNFSTVSHDDEDYSYHKKKMMRDPMSHRIIEKRRRDRMNNCLADLSRLIPPDYLKKGRGRIEKTEIIEMAIKHMRHLQNIISASRMGETQCENPATSPPVALPPSAASHQPIIVEHYRLGYLECLSEAMHFLVEVQGYFAGDSLCVQMIDHLHKHCDKILKNDSLNYPRKHTGETTSSNSSTSPTNGNYSNNSPPLGLSISNGSNSDDNQTSAPYDSGRSFEPIEDPLRSVHSGFRSPRRYSDLSSGMQSRDDTKAKNCESFYRRYSETESERIAENRSDSDLEQGFTVRSKEGRNYVRGYDELHKGIACLPRNYSSSSGIGSGSEYPLSYDELFVKEENGSSQLRDMLSSPRMGSAGHSDSKRSASPSTQLPVCDAPSARHFLSHHHRPNSPGEESQHQTEALNYKAQNGVAETEDATNREVHPESSAADAHGNMYKFKNNIKQRFSKERRDCEESEEDQFGKKAKLSGGACPQNEGDPLARKYMDPLMKERLHLLTKGDDEYENRKRGRFVSESENQIHSEMDNISNRLSFGHKAGSRLKKWDERSKNLRAKHSPPYFASEPAADYRGGETGNGRKPMGLLTIAEYLPPEPAVARASFDGAENERDVGIPIFALHSKGSFYIPLTLHQSTLAPFLSLLGLTKPEEVEEKAVLHPVTISVNFQMSYMSKSHGRPLKYSS